MAFTDLAPPFGGTTPSADALRDPTLAGLRGRSAADPKAAVREAAKQFESLFMQEVMKSLRRPRSRAACSTTPARSSAPSCSTPSSPTR